MSSRSRSRQGRALMIAGMGAALGSGVVGFVWLSRAPELRPVPFGEQVEITATGAGAVSVFTPTGRATAPQCRAATQDGRNVTLGESRRYQQAEGMESSYGFTTESGLTYRVSCGDPGEAGRFAVAEVGRFPEAVLLAVGSLGLLACAAGGVLDWRHRRTPPRR